jgi:Ca-activated chloride channel family protein
MNTQNSMADGLGYSVGGAKDIANFRANIDANYLPQSSDLTYEGLFYDYYFDTGARTECEELFCPSYSYALTKDPFSKKDDYYLSVGLNSGLKASEFKRKKLNLVVVLDISGSMGSSFNRYYYDQVRNGTIKTDLNESDEDKGKSKIEIANKSIVALLGHLSPDDRFGMVLFDNTAYLAKPLGLVGETDMEKLKQHILEIGPQGGTNFEAGMKEGSAVFDNYLNANQDEYENRIIFLTDAMPNIGDISEDGLMGMTKKNADNKVYITFIGIGVDFQTKLIEEITKIRGANYYSVHSATEFKNRLDNEFEYMVTPLVFNLNLKLDTTGFEIEKVYGSPEANESTGQIMKINTLFPSATTEEGTKGGLVLLKLKKISQDATMNLKVTYEDRSGKTAINETNVIIPQVQSEYFENNGLRKGILLARYADLMKNWLNDEMRAEQVKTGTVKVYVNSEDGIIVPIDLNFSLNEWEHQSSPLVVSSEYKTLFAEFRTYFESEKQIIGDETLSQETQLLDKLISK